jgi:anti-anti-sigma factor
MSGEIDLAWEEEHRADIQGFLWDCPPRLLVDLTAVSFMDCRGLAFLAACVRATSPRNGEVTVLNPTRLIKREMSIVGLGDQLTVRDQRLGGVADVRLKTAAGN